MSPTDLSMVHGGSGGGIRVTSALQEPVRVVAGGHSDSTTTAVEGICCEGLVCHDEATYEGGLNVLWLEAAVPAVRGTVTARPEVIRDSLFAQVDRIYLLARAGYPGFGQRYLEITLATTVFLNREYPYTSETRRMNHLAVDIATWLDWDAKGASIAVCAGVAEAARYTAAHPEPNCYVTLSLRGLPIASRRLPGPVCFVWPHWVPSWLRGWVPHWILGCFIPIHLEGTPRIHPCDHRQRARNLLAMLKVLPEAA